MSRGYFAGRFRENEIEHQKALRRPLLVLWPRRMIHGLPCW